MFTWQHFKWLVTLCCVLATIGTSVWQILTYLKNEEVTEVSFRRYHDSKHDVYPSVTLCFPNQFNDSELQQSGEGTSAESYAAFLQGKLWNPDLVNASFDRISMDLKQYILRVGGKRSNWTYFDYSSDEDFEHLQNSSALSIFSIPASMVVTNCIACFTLNVPFEKGSTLQSLWIEIRTDVFPNRIRPHEGLFTMVLHYPHQAYWSMHSAKQRWPTRGIYAAGSYTMMFDIWGIEVVRQRTNGKPPCDEDISDFDAEMKQRVMESEGCKPPYWSSISSLPPCWKIEQMKQIADKIYHAAEFDVQPCRVLQNPTFVMTEVDATETREPDSFTMQINYNNLDYKEIKRVRGMDVQTLIGNIRLCDDCKAFTNYLFTIPAISNGIIFFKLR